MLLQVKEVTMTKEEMAKGGFQGFTMELPFKVGDEVHVLSGCRIHKGIVSSIEFGKDMEMHVHIEDSHCYYTSHDIGTHLFATENNAKEALRSLEKAVLSV